MTDRKSNTSNQPVPADERAVLTADYNAVLKVYGAEATVRLNEMNLVALAYENAEFAARQTNYSEYKFYRNTYFQHRTALCAKLTSCPVAPVFPAPR